LEREQYDDDEEFANSLFDLLSRQIEHHASEVIELPALGDIARPIAASILRTAAFGIKTTSLYT